MARRQKRLRGFALLEALLVFLVAAIIFLLGIGHYHHLLFNKDVMVLQKNESILMQALDTYYHEHANDKNASGELTFPLPESPADPGGNSYKNNLKNVSESGLWPKIWPESGGRLLPTRFVEASSLDDSSYDVRIIRSASDPRFKLQVVIVIKTNISGMPELYLVNWFKHIFSATDAVGQEDGSVSLTWETLPEYTLHDVKTNLWILDSGLRQFQKNSTE